MFKKILNWFFPISERDKRLMEMLEDASENYDIETWTSYRGYLCGSFTPKPEYVQKCWNEIVDTFREIEKNNLEDYQI